MKNKEAFELHQALIKLLGIPSHGKFAYAVFKNYQKLMPVIKELFDIQKSPEHVVVYDNARIALCEKWAEKKDGKSVIENGGYKIPEKSRNKFDDELQKLQNQHQQAVDDLKIIEQKANEWGEQEAQIAIHKVSPEFLPELSPAMIQALDIMIEEPGLIQKPVLTRLK